MTDGTAEVKATMSSPAVEKIIPFTPQEILAAICDGHSVSHELSRALERQEDLCCITTYRVMNNGIPERMFSVLPSLFV